MRCIWCSKETFVEPVEHIIPDSLGCPDDLVFRNGEVCRKCNDRNAPLDQAISAEFDIARLMANVPNKRGKPPQIATRPNAEGGYRNGECYINVNMDRTDTVRGCGRNLKPFAKRSNDLEMSMERTSTTYTKVKIRQNGVCNSKECVRALHKIAFSVFAHKFGVDEALAERFNAVREYVRRGRGERTVLLAAASDRFDYRNFACASDGSMFPTDVVAFQLACLGFVVDLSPNQDSLQALKEMHTKLLGTKWTWTPIGV